MKRPSPGLGAPRFPGLSPRFFGVTRALAVTVAVGAVLSGCTADGKSAAARAKFQAEELVHVIDTDVDGLRRGLPLGAADLGNALYVTGKTEPVEAADVRKGLRRIRVVIPALRESQSNFMTLATLDGVGIRSDLEEDRMAGRKLFDIFKNLEGTKAEAFSAAVGTFDTPGGPMVDDDFAAMVPVVHGGEVRSFLIAGWSFRSFARHLQNEAERLMTEKRKDHRETDKAPVLYVAIADDRGTFGGPTTPKVNLAALQALAPTTLPSGSSGTLEIEGRSFGWSVAKAPALGERVAVVVLRSDL